MRSHIKRLLFLVILLCGIGIGLLVNPLRNVDTSDGNIKRETEIGRIFIDDYEKRTLISNQTIGYNLQISDIISSEDLAVYQNFLQSRELSHIVFFRFSEKYCFSCVENELINVLEAQKDGFRDICIIGTITDPVSKNLFKNTYLRSGIFVTASPNLNLPIESSGLPYYFTINQFNRINKLIIPDLHNPGLTEKWLYQCSIMFN